MDGGRPSILRWNSQGTVLGIALEGGSLGIIDVESAKFSSSITTVAHNFSQVTNISWAHFSDEDVFSSHHIAETLIHGGRNIETRCGMSVLPESNAEHVKSGLPLSSSIDTSSPLLMLSITSDCTVRGHVFGIYPIFTIRIPDIVTVLSPSIEGKFMSSRGVLFVWENRMIPKKTITFSTYSCPYFKSNRFQQFQLQSKIVVSMEHTLQKLNDSILAFGKKWKDATKVILPKMQLLRDVMNGYQLELDPVEFMFTISECGMWHPAAAASFPNQWNEQGISRLRSSVDSVLLALIKYFTMTALPLVKNMILNSK